MALASGNRLGPYEILAPLGVGGQGEVYSARDTRLDRKVAVKILSAEYASDAKLRVRFEREAKAISALNHPHICALYDVGSDNGFDYLVMEHCDGKTLAQRLVRGPLPLDQVLEYGIQISDALEGAHRTGIIHRDLKPSNVMLTKSGVKLLDFGLARQESAAVDSSNATTMPLTEENKIVGTLRYMAPETVSHGRVDARSDIFALGLVLYEMATGTPAFSGSSKASLIAAILEHEPKPLTDLRPATPAALDRLIRSCLVKDPEARLGTAGDVAIALRWLRESRPQDTFSVGPMRRWLPVSVAAACVIVAAATVVIATRGRPVPARPSAPPHMTFRQITNDVGLEIMPAISPDGKFVAYVSARSGKNDIYLQRVGGSRALNLTASSGANNSQPAFSRDGQWIAFHSDREGGGVFMMGATGESVRRVSDFGWNPSWSPNGREIVVCSKAITTPRRESSRLGELWIIDVNSSSRRRLSSSTTDGDALQPSWSPHGQRIAFWRVRGARSFTAHIATMPAGGGKPVPLLEDEHNDMTPVWSPDGRHLYFSSDRGGSVNLWRVGIDEVSGKTTGDPEPVTLPARTAWPVSIAADGRTLAYCVRASRWNLERVTLAPDGTLVEGPVPVFGRTTDMNSPEVSPDGQWITYLSDDHVYVSRINGSDVLPLTEAPGKDKYPAWSPDGKRIAFHSDRGGKSEIWIIGADGSGLTEVTSDSTPIFYPRWSRDGSRISTRADKACKAGTCIVDMRGPYPLSPRGELLPAYKAEPQWLFVNHDWSPDGRWLLGGVWLDATHPTRMVVYSLETRMYTKLLDACPVWECIARWMPDNRHILFSDGRRIQMIDRLTAKIHEVVDTGSAIDSFITVTRDGRYVYFVSSSEESDVWVATMN